MAAETWKARLRGRVIEVDGLCGSVLRLLAAAQPHLASPMHTGDAVGVRARIQLAQDTLGNASSDLAFAASLMGAARELALRGGTLIPAVPLSSIHHLRDQDLAERNAVIKLRDARPRAVDAYDLVEWCRSRLWAACLLLDHPGLPGVDGFIDAERLSAVAALENAMELAEESAALAGGAREDVSGAN